MKVFKAADLTKLYKPASDSSGEDNGQVTIIGGSKLFHGAPLFPLKVASRIVDMVFFASPEPSVGEVANKLKSELLSFIWVPWDEIGEYIKKSDAALIGPGFMSFRGEKDRSLVEETKEITHSLLTKFSNKHWVIDAGSLQVMEASWIPKNAIITPNKHEFEILFGNKIVGDENEKMKVVQKYARKHNCIIVFKGPETLVCSSDKCVKVTNGNPGLTKGGTGDTLAGLTVAFLAKNDPFSAAASASFIAKSAADDLYEKVGPNYNADDLADKIPESFWNLLQKRP